MIDICRSTYRDFLNVYRIMGGMSELTVQL